jgi:lipopolysaccharide transport system permease protein
VIPFLVQLWMFATPSVYMHVGDEPGAAVRMPAAAAAAPPSPVGPAGSGTVTGSGLVHATLTLNPLTGLIGAFRASVLGGHTPWGKLVVPFACAGFAFVLGCLYFRRVEDGFADII